MPYYESFHFYEAPCISFHFCRKCITYSISPLFNSDMAKIRMMTPCLFLFYFMEKPKTSPPPLLSSQPVCLETHFFSQDFCAPDPVKTEVCINEISLPKKKSLCVQKTEYLPRNKSETVSPKKDILTIFSLALSEEKLSL